IDNDILIKEYRSLCYYSEQYLEEIIKIFQCDYRSENAIWWYVHVPFFQRLINEAFRTNNINTLLKFQSYLYDVHNQINLLHLKQLSVDNTNKNIIVYRGQLISVDELQVLKDNINGLVSMNTFLLATNSYEVATTFAGNGINRPLFESILFEIDIDTNIFTIPY
ncbi:unnamed protein product, partial [Didymodactylos carnosus]